ncbi:MAG: hypothetical protein HY321_06165 [Armatimonadetes bacterium]|nr:hypothetical protein [Armatimonadota bacterium]
MELGLVHRNKRELTAEDRARVPREIVRLAAGAPRTLARALLLYRAHAHWRAGEEAQLAAAVALGLQSHIDQPEFLLLKGATPEGRSQQSATRLELGRILPLTYGRDLDSVLSAPVFPPDLKLRPESHHDIIIPRMPWLSAEKTLVEIGDLYWQMGLRRDAMNSYVEVCYGGSPSEPAKHWLRIAALEAEMGETELAVRAYLRALFLGARTEDAVVNGLEACLDPARPALVPAPPVTPDADALRRMCAAYARIHLHPLGLALIRRAKQEWGIDLSAIEPRIREELEQNLDVVRRARKLEAFGSPHRPHYYGQEIATVKDWATIVILRPSDTYWKPAASKTGDQPAAR